MSHAQEPYTQALWLAATLGPFEPAELLRTVAGDSDDRESLATQLAAVCVEVSSPSGEMRWNLGPEARRSAFAQMDEAGVLSAAALPTLVSRLEPESEDAFGRALREALAGRDAPPEAQSELPSYYSAYEFVGGSKVGVNPEAARETAGRIDQQSQRANADRELILTIGPNFVGRDRELGALEYFARKGDVVDPEFRVAARPHPERVPLLFVNGVGGAGKSSMIAKFVQQSREDTSWPGLILVIDFDRPSLAGLNPVELTAEFLRQLALCVPEQAHALRGVRRNVRSEFNFLEVASSNVSTNYRANERAQYSTNSQLRGIVARTGLRDRPLLLILDTFEEVLTLGRAYVSRVYRWLEDLREQAGIEHIRAVLSGRARADELATAHATGDTSPDSLDANVVGAIPVGDLPPAEALEVLTTGQIPDEGLASRLLERFGRNPLVLRLLNEYADQEGLHAAADLLTDEKSAAEYKAAFAQRALYSRILGRIRADEDLRTLASPGLVVRVVTPGIIRDVLADPCGLEDVSDDRALELFQSLARHVWLVKESGARSVRHRRDTRTVMLPLATEPSAEKSKEQLTKTVEEIHRNALRYHSGVRDPELSEETQRLEAIYHALFCEPRVTLESPALKPALPDLARDIGDFAPATRARLKQMMNRTLTREEIAALEAEERREYEQRQTAQQISHTGMTVESAPAAVEPTHAGMRVSGRSKSRQTAVTEGRKTKAAKPAAKRAFITDPTALIAAYQACDFEPIAAAAPELTMTFLDRAASRRGLKLERDMTEHPVWLAALATLAVPWEGRGDSRLSWANEIFAGLQDKWKQLSTFYLEDKSGFSVAHFLAALAVLVSRGRALGDGSRQCLDRLGRAGMRTNRANLSSAAALRILHMHALADDTGERTVSVAYAAAPVMQFYAGLLDEKAAADRPSLRGVRQAWQMPSPNLARLQKYLGSINPMGGGIRSSVLDGMQRMGLLEMRIDLYDWNHPRAPVGKKSLSNQKTLAWPALRGMSPDLQVPLVTALRERMADRTRRLSLLTDLAACSQAWPVDFLEAGRSERKVSDTFVATVAHHADRFALLPVLLGGAGKNSLAMKVASVHAVYEEMFMRVVKGAATMKPPPPKKPHRAIKAMKDMQRGAKRAAKSAKKKVKAAVKKPLRA